MRELSNSSFPGILPTGDILGLLKLFSSKNAMNDISAKIALDGGFDPCKKFSGNEFFLTDNFGCEPGFVTDDKYGYFCYRVLPTLETLNEGHKKCEYIYDAEAVLFHTNFEVEMLKSVIKTGIKSQSCSLIIYIVIYPMMNICLM